MSLNFFAQIWSKKAGRWQMAKIDRAISLTFAQVKIVREIDPRWPTKMVNTAEVILIFFVLFVLSSVCFFSHLPSWVKVFLLCVLTFRIGSVRPLGWRISVQTQSYKHFYTSWLGKTFYHGTYSAYNKIDGNLRMWCSLILNKFVSQIKCSVGCFFF